MKKKNWKIPAILVLGLVLIFAITSFVGGNKSEIEKLRTAKVKVNYSKGKVHYELTNKTPLNWVNFQNISKKAREAIVTSEDALFWQHEGFDMNQIKDAVVDHLEKGKKLRGASTITQQLVKNVFLTNEKTVSRKAKEAIITKEIESKLSKEKILETYLNVIEYGKGIYGIKAAAKHYFNKTPAQLNAKEGAFLAMLLPNPKKYAESFRKRELTPYADKTVSNILLKMKKTKKITNEEYDVLIEGPLTFAGSNTAANVGEEAFGEDALNERDAEIKELSDSIPMEKMDKNVKDTDVFDPDAMIKGIRSTKKNVKTAGIRSFYSIDHAVKPLGNKSDKAEKERKRLAKIEAWKKRQARIAAKKRKRKRNKFDQKKLKELRSMIKKMDSKEKSMKGHDGGPIVKKVEDLKAPGDLATNDKLIQDEVIGVEEEMSLE